MGAVWSVRRCIFPPRDFPAQKEDENPEFASLGTTSGEPEVLSIQRDEQPVASAMTMRCKLALQKSYKDLIRDLDVNRTIDCLFSRLILTKEDKQRIEGVSADHHRRRALLDLLPERSQRAFDEFLESLSLDQPWLKDTLMRNYENITEDELAKMKDQDLSGLPTAMLQEALKRNMQDRLDEWKTALEEGVSDTKGLLPYINQPYSLETKPSQQQRVMSTRGKIVIGNTFREHCEAFQQQPVPNIIEVVEESCPGDRITVYGEAGMGKTTLLKQLARSWIEGGNSKMADKFTYVFLIPLRYVGKSTLLHTICDELGLVPMICLEELKKLLHLCEHRLLFLMDSYEELRDDVVHAKRSDIEDLITGKLFPKSTVVVTSRPGSKLPQPEHPTTAKLEDLPENEVETIIKHHLDDKDDAVDQVERSFPAMAFLQKPINLALFIFIITQNKHLTLSYTQAELFSLVLQHIMLAFAKKKKLVEFIPQSGSYIANKDIPKDIRRLFSAIAKKCYDERDEDNVTLHVEDADDLKEYLDFGLFTAGKDPNTVLLPHRLFIDYFAAAHLAENPIVWTKLFDEIKEKFSQAKYPFLPDLVRPMGLENVLRFLVALSPQPHLEHICLQIGSLFVVERRKIDELCDNYQLISVEYYTELLQDCGEESGKRVLTTALLSAPVRDIDARYSDEENKPRSHILLTYLGYKQCGTFLKKIHKLNLCTKEGKSTLSCIGHNKRLCIGDTFVLALVYWYDCSIEADELDIRGAMPMGLRLDLPASVFTRMSGVRHLRLERCTLCEELPDYMSDIGISVTSQQSSPCPTNSSLEKVVLSSVEGLEHCDFIMSSQCQLVMKWCGRLRACTWFPKVSELKLGVGTALVYETEGELTSWLSTVQTVRELGLVPEHEEESLSLCHLFNILAEVEVLECLKLYRYTLLLDVRDGPTCDTVKQNNMLSKLRLEHCNCKKGVNLGQLLEVCSRQCPQLREVTVGSSNLVFDDDEKVKSVKQLRGLERFTLEQSPVHTPAGRWLSDDEVKQHLRRLCPSAQIEFVLSRVECIVDVD